MHVCAVCILVYRVYSYCISNICIKVIVIGSRVAQCKGPHFQIYSYILYIFKANMFVPISVHACAMLRLRPASSREGMEHSRGDWPQQVMHVQSILYMNYIFTLHYMCCLIFHFRWIDFLLNNV